MSQTRTPEAAAAFGGIATAVLAILTLVALLVVGLTNIISGSALSGLVLSFMRSEGQTPSSVMR